MLQVTVTPLLGGGDNSSKLEFQEWHLGADCLGDFKVFCFFRKKIGWKKPPTMGKTKTYIYSVNLKKIFFEMKI